MTFIKIYDIFNESLYSQKKTLTENEDPDLGDGLNDSVEDILLRHRLKPKSVQDQQYSEYIYDTPENQREHFVGFTSPNYHFMCYAPGVGDIYLYHDSYPAIGQPRKMFVIKTSDKVNDYFYKGPEDVYNENTPIDRALRYVKNSKKFKSFYGIV